MFTRGLQRKAPCAWVFLRFSSSSTSRTHFQILDVSRDSTIHEIKQAFYRKAKRLHPDVNTEMNLQQANDEFIRIKTAFDTLSDESKRLKYLNELDNPHLYRQREDHVSKQHQYQYDDDDIAWSRSRMNTNNPRGFKRKNRSIIPAIQSSWAQFQAELELALAKAYHGPLFTPDKDMEYPDAFEAEERSRRSNNVHVSSSTMDHTNTQSNQNVENNPTANNVIIQLVSGRQLLGSVSVIEPLHHQADSSPSNHYNHAPESMNNLSSWANNEPLTNLLHQHFAISSVSSDTASFKSIFQHIFGASVSGKMSQTPTATAEATISSTSSSSLPVLTQEILQLTWLGNIVARATRLTCTKRPDQSAIIFETCTISDRDTTIREEMHTNDPATPNASSSFSSFSSKKKDTNNQEQYTVIATLLCSATTSAISHSRARNILFNERLEETHAVIRHSTPGVQSMWFYSRKGFIEFLCSRAWLPTSTLWYFQPRDEHFDNGGWYIEHNKHGQRSERTSFYQKYKPREGFYSARNQSSSANNKKTGVSDAEMDNITENSTTISSPHDMSPSSPVSSSSSSSKDQTNNREESISSSSLSEEFPLHVLHDSNLMIQISKQQTHDNINHRHHQSTDTNTTNDGLLHAEKENQNKSMEELPSLHHSVCIFTCAFTTLTKLKTNRIYP